jgi:hypothetical protein
VQVSSSMARVGSRYAHGFRNIFSVIESLIGIPTEYRQKKLLYNRGTPWHRGTVFAGGEQILNRQN